MVSPRRWCRNPSGGRRQRAATASGRGTAGCRRPGRRSAEVALLGVEFAVELAKVEVGGRGEHRVLLRLLYPAEELLLPGPQWDPPGRGWWSAMSPGQRTSPHCSSVAARCSARAANQSSAPGAAPSATTRAWSWSVRERALPAGPAAEDEERVRAWGRPERLAVTSGADIEGIVGAGQEPVTSAGWGAGRTSGRAAAVVTSRAEAASCSGPVAWSSWRRTSRGWWGLLLQQVGVGDDPDQPSSPGQGQVVDALLGDGQHHLADGAVGRDGVQRRGHDLAYGCVRRRPAASTRSRRLCGGHQARRPAVDDQRRHEPVAHAPAGPG